MFSDLIFQIFDQVMVHQPKKKVQYDVFHVQFVVSIRIISFNSL